MPLLMVLGALAVGAVTFRSVSRVAEPSERSRSSTIAWGPERASLWVTSPDDDQVVEIDPSTLEPRRRIAVSGRPEELTLVGRELLVTGSQSTDLTVIGLPTRSSGGDRTTAPQITRVPIPCGGSRSVVTARADGPGPARELALVTCPTDDRVVVVDLEASAAVASWPLRGRPTGIVRDGEQVSVSTAGDGKVRTFPLASVAGLVPSDPPADGDPAPAIRPIGASVRPAWVDGERSASLLGALDAGSVGTLGVYQVVDNTTRLATTQIGRSTYGNPVDGRARLEPALTGPCGARFADFAQPSRVLSGPVALAASPDDELIWVVGQFSHSVSVVRCDGAPARGHSDTVASFAVGEGARGIVLAADGRTGYVDVGFDHEIARLGLPADVDEVKGDAPIERGQPADVGRRTINDTRLSPLAQAGRRMFTDATDTHLTPFGVVTCASCHPGAGDDGLAWRIETRDADAREIERKVRRTPAAWQIDTEVKPLHWNGEFTSTDDLVLSTIQRLQGGDGLLVDTAAISAYLAEAQAPPGVPDAADVTDVVERGRAIFESDAAGCARCHVGDAGTDGLGHDVLTPGSVPDARLTEVITPPLRGVRGRAPYGHDGRAADLVGLLRQHGDGHGSTIALTPTELADVMAYLRSR